MSNFARRRIQNEYNELMRNSSNYWSLRPKDDMLHWEGNIHNLDCPKHSGKEYTLEIVFSENYPFVPPRITFITPIKCENVYGNGELYMDILDREWTPAITIYNLMFSICSLLICKPVSNIHYRSPSTARISRSRT